MDMMKKEDIKNIIELIKIFEKAKKSEFCGWISLFRLKHSITSKFWLK